MREYSGRLEMGCGKSANKRREDGREFQSRGEATAKARDCKLVEYLGTVRKFPQDERKDQKSP